MTSIALLNGLLEGLVADTIREALAATGRLESVHDLRHERFAPCQGCFECWHTHPGTCKAHDAANEIMPDIIAADTVVWTTSLRFGCWGPHTKVALDKSIGLLSPFFTTVHGETHHVKRYRAYPRWVVVAVVTGRTSSAERETFRKLVARNALNVHAPTCTVAFVREDADAGEVRTVVTEALTPASTPGFPMVEPYPAREDAIGISSPLDRHRRALLWVGSAKPAGESTSESLGCALLDALEQRGWDVDTLRVGQAVKLSRPRAPALIDAVGRADLVILSTPVYVDCLPSLVLAGLARLADVGATAALLPIVQCGFPELAHTSLALEVLDHAAREIGLRWAGHLALGGGGMIGGRPLQQLGGRVHHQRLAIEAAADRLDRGLPLDASVTGTFAQAPLSPRLYRLAGQVGWIIEAARNHALFDLWDRPFDEDAR